MLHGLCALQMNGDEIVRVIDKDMDSDALDDFLDTYGVEATNDVFLYYFGDADDGAMKTGSVSLIWMATPTASTLVRTAALRARVVV